MDLTEKMLKLRVIEMNDSVGLIMEGLHKHMQNLKGDYLTGVINQIRSL